MTATGIDIDITVPGFFTRPDYFDVLSQLRRERPVFPSEPGTWLVTRYDDIRAISREPARFSSARGVLINDPARGANAQPIDGSILHMDPPVHVDYRKIVSREFTPRATGAMEVRVREIVARVFDRLPVAEEIDFVAAVAAPIPVLVIAELLGIADGDLADFRRWSDAVIEITDDPAPETFAATVELFGFLDRHIAERKAQPRDDMISLLVATDLTPAAVLMFCLTLLVAGNETTRHLLSGGAEAMVGHPDQRAALAAAPDAIPVAVEELLRWVTPIQAFARTAVADLVIGGESIAAGDYLVMLYASGNRDEAAFGPTADRLDLRRPVDTTHVAFGFGEHLCLGASLARLEARAVFGALLDRFPKYEVVAPPELTRSTLVRGAVTMPVVLR